MDWKQKRLITLLSTILGILFVAVLLVGGMRWRQYRAVMAEKPVAAVLPGEEPVLHPYTALRYDNGSFTLSFALDETTGLWTWADDPDFPLDERVVHEICSILMSLKPQQTLAPESELSEYQLSEPDVILEATEADGDILTISFGKSTTDGESCYTLINHDTSVLYILENSLLEPMSVPIYDMMKLPEFPALTAATIRSFSVHGTLFTALDRRTEGESSYWQSGGVDVTDSNSLANLLADLPQIELLKCIDYKPSEEALGICGFEPPAALLRAEYVTAAGAEESVSLAIGTKTIDGSGYYACFNGDTTIYQVAPDCVDTLLAVAEAGLVS